MVYIWSIVIFQDENTVAPSSEVDADAEQHLIEECIKIPFKTREIELLTYITIGGGLDAGAGFVKNCLPAEFQNTLKEELKDYVNLLYFADKLGKVLVVQTFPDWNKWLV